MDAKWKAKWLKALRSGEYKQGVKQLHPTTNTYCCLGVLCDIYTPHKMIYSHYSKSYQYKNNDTALPLSIREEVNITRDQHIELVCLNDTLKYNFKQIADWIEKNL